MPFRDLPRGGVLLLLALLSIVNELSWPTPARAQTQVARDERRGRARFEQARTAFTEGRYEDALLLFRESHTLSHKAVLLYNIANTLDRLRRDREAIQEYERYLQALPDAENRAQVETRLLVLRRTAEEQETRQANTLAPSHVAAASLHSGAQGHASTGPLAGASERDAQPVYKKWWLWSAVGTAVVAAIVVGIVASNREPEPRQGPLLLDSATRKVPL